MAVIRTGKKKLIKAGFLGAAIGAAVMVPVCTMLAFSIVRKNSTINNMQMELGKYKSGTVYVLKNDIKKGETLSNEDIELVKGTFYQNVTLQNAEDFIGKILRTDARSGMVLSDCFFSDEEEQNIRTYYIDYIEIPPNYALGNYIDIRICFPNGEDYLVAGKKRINDMDEVGVYINLSPEEALYMSSARTDCTIYDVTRIYAVYYIDDFENAGNHTYPVNSYVLKLGQWEPNLFTEIFNEEMYLKRTALEENLFDFMGVTNNK